MQQKTEENPAMKKETNSSMRLRLVHSYFRIKDDAV